MGKGGREQWRQDDREGDREGCGGMGEEGMDRGWDGGLGKEQWRQGDGEGYRESVRAEVR